MNKIKKNILELLEQRQPSETICPSEVARKLFPHDWRGSMDEVRQVAMDMAKDKMIDITQKGKTVTPPFKGPIRLRLIIDYRQSPELYRVLKGEQGVLTFEPYKSELLPSWRFSSPEMARHSSEQLLKKFYSYLDELDFAGMDMARKFIQMGYTRSRRYANHKSGKKYDGRKMLPLDVDPEKAESAAIFKRAWDEVEANEIYQELKRDWKLWYG